MTFARRGLFSLGFALLLWVFISPVAVSQPSPNRTDPKQPAPAQSIGVQPDPQQAYSLPPEKLAKAIALGRIRNILDIVGSLWGLAMLWLLLATRAAARPGPLVRAPLAPPLGARPSLLRRAAQHSDAGWFALGPLQSLCQPQLRHQRARPGRLVWRSSQSSRPFRAYRLAGHAAL